MFAINISFSSDHNKQNNTNSKLGVNMIYLLAIGDINVFWEEQLLKSSFSFVSSVHFITGKLNNADTDLRVSLGGRYYQSSSENTTFGIDKYFFEFKTSISRVKGTYTPTLEFGIGKALSLNKNISFANKNQYYEWKIGLARFFDKDGYVVPIIGFGIGFTL